MRFIDLFAGLGGFHLALQDLGHECVFACEIDDSLRETYRRNFGMSPEGDIRLIDINALPSHDILCAGFPCQPFSKAGRQKGLRDRERGRLFYDILRIVRYHKPTYLIMENVPNLIRHKEGRTWAKLERLLRKEGYHIQKQDLSPHQFGIPQTRLRTYIVASRKPLDNFAWPERDKKPVASVSTFLEKRPKDAWKVSPQINRCLGAWQEFLRKTPENERMPLPVWAMEFGATYPYESTTPFALTLDKLKRYKGSFGGSIVGPDKRSAMMCLPSHARREQRRFPKWKANMIRKNREFYSRNKAWLDSWMEKIKEFTPSLQKFEWNCNGEPRDLRPCVVQLRASGVRAKRQTSVPTLVAMNLTQVPIIPWEERYMTLTECMRLQSMDRLRNLPASKVHAYRALGNAVNVQVVSQVANSLISSGEGKAQI